MIITIDGPIATGKSTIAKRLAHDIGFIYFDTGAMYRCLTYGIIKNNINFENPVSLEAFLDTFKFEIKVKHSDRFYFIDEEDVSLKIRGNEVTSLVSKVSAIPQVRQKLTTLQRDWAVGVNAVFEGRDMGTVVFPEAELKIFLIGRPEIRAARRYAELKAKFPKETETLTIEQVLKDIDTRDTSDSQRELSPLKQAENACVVDTSDLNIDEIIFKILEYKDTMRTRLKNF